MGHRSREELPVSECDAESGSELVYGEGIVHRCAVAPSNACLQDSGEDVDKDHLHDICHGGRGKKGFFLGLCCSIEKSVKRPHLSRW